MGIGGGCVGAAPAAGIALVCAGGASEGDVSVSGWCLAGSVGLVSTVSEGVGDGGSSAAVTADEDDDVGDGGDDGEPSVSPSSAAFDLAMFGCGRDACGSATRGKILETGVGRSGGSDSLLDVSKGGTACEE